jgi:hypothetical protein
MMQRYLKYLDTKEPITTASDFKHHCDIYKQRLKQSLPRILRAIPNRDLNALVVEFTLQNLA